MRIYILFLLFQIGAISFSQVSYTSEELFEEGLYFYQREDYNEALYFFSKLLIESPNNANYNFKVGECYLNIPGQEHLAVEFFEKAAKKIVPKKSYKQRDFNEKSAPLHALFYLGNAYRIDGQLEKALEVYNTFMESPYFIDNYNFNVVEREIKSCERAKIIKDSPIDLEKESFSELINTSYTEHNAILSSDGKTLVFVRGMKFYDGIFMAKKGEKGWGKPVNINQEIISDGDYYPTGLNSDGTMLLLTREIEGNSDIYLSHYRDSVWSLAMKISEKINTMANETYASFGASDEEIYLVSDRKGNKDIYICKKNGKGQWGKPKILGDVVNSKEDEDTPVICNNGKTLFFSSKNHYNMGGYDIFYSNLEKGWSIPRNIGYPLNTTRDDLFFITDKSCKKAIYSIIDVETGISDIYMIEVKSSLVLP